MAGFGFGSRKEPPTEEQEASNDSPELPDRVASLRELDEKIRRRDDELRSSKEAERATPTPAIGPDKASASTESADSGSAVGATLEDIRKEIFKFAGRVEALESSVPETQRRNWEALQEQQKLIEERLGELEKLAGDALAEATDAGAQADARFKKLGVRIKALDERLRDVQDESRSSIQEALSAQGPLDERLDGLEKLTARIKALEELPQRVEGLDERLGAVQDESRSSLEEARSAQRPLEERLAALEKLAARVEALEDLPERIEGVGKQVTSAREIADGADARHKTLAARVTELEALERKAASGSRKLEQRAVETMESLAARTELAEVVGRLSARVAALDRRLNQAAEKESGHAQERPTNGEVDLNEATFEQLRSLGLSATQAARVISARDGLGGFTSTGQLDGIPGLPEKDLQELKRGVRLSAGGAG